MKTYTATEARKNIYKLIESVGNNHDAIQITSKSTSAVLVSQDDWLAIQDTLHLLSVPDMRESLIEGMQTDIADCDEELDW